VEQEFQGQSPGTQSVDRAAQLLVGVLEGDRPQAVAELSERANLPKSTASRTSLERQGRRSASQRSATARSQAAKTAARTKGPRVRSRAAKRAAVTRSRHAR